jgi:uncharacterized coiled-coil DUF342 family protein
MKNPTNKPAQEIIRPAQMAEAQSAAENILKLSLMATELNFSIEGRRGEIRDLEAKLAEVRKTYAAMKPKALGLLAVLD